MAAEGLDYSAGLAMSGPGNILASSQPLCVDLGTVVRSLDSAVEVLWGVGFGDEAIA